MTEMPADTESGREEKRDLMTNERPLVSVYIPTRNRIELLRLALRSVLQQTYDNFEVIIVDDGSDEPVEVALEQEGSLDPRVSIHRLNPGQGAAHARNVAISLSRGTFITGLDDDDCFMPEHLELMLTNYDDRYSFVAPNYIEKIGDLTRSKVNHVGAVTLHALVAQNLVGNQVFVRKDRVQAIGGFNERLEAMIDWELWIRLVLNYGSAYRYAECTYVFRNESSYERISHSSAKVIRALRNMHQHLGQSVGAQHAQVWLQYAAYRSDGSRLRRAWQILSLAGGRNISVTMKLAVKALIGR